MQIKKYRGFFLFPVVICILFACSKMDDSYKDFTKDGEIIYTGKADSVKAYPGNNRILLSMLLVSDPKISRVKVFWNNKADSAVQDIVRTDGIDTVKFMLTNMPEGTYNFEIYTYDNAGHSSIRVETIGIVYGQNYVNSLFNRPLKKISYVTGSKAMLIWYGPSSQTIGQEITYTDSLGVPTTRYEWVKNKKDTTILNNFKNQDYFQYRTLYKPDSSSIDTFYSNFESKQVL